MDMLILPLIVVAFHDPDDDKSWSRIRTLKEGMVPNLYMKYQVLKQVIVFSKVLEGLGKSWRLLGTMSTHTGISPTLW